MEVAVVAAVLIVVAEVRDAVLAAATRRDRKRANYSFDRQRHRQEAVVRQNGMQRSVVGALFQTNSYQHSRSDKSFIDHLDMTEFVSRTPSY
mmetsp:Transcript_77384/g.113353  ORF Transcript_77384/g.113353 Transcript_77384/m.113353 type:complete len:92 (+) Transcript_77384:728-1003(+)